ncbi:type III secretion system stator protein SctL [Pseudomonas sp. LG1E9]|uniref:type III secretion system stator protein SctL n=1 Tax=Pseudomonas sp. LG1E9 TaxID=2219057 RepID=UPI000DD3F4D9|nr:type III secretion system stator protein SctL [Pseudomonas sp. LG1E9]
MLCLHKIELHKNGTRLPLPLIPHEVVADITKANQLLEHAKAQAHELRRLTEEECKTLLKKTTVEIWQRADDQLKRWEREHEKILESLEYYASMITRQAISCILDETIESKRLTVLVKKLLVSQMPQINAKLLCSPTEIDAVTQYLAIHGAARWTLQADEAIPPQTLILKTDEGDFCIDWNSMLDIFFKHDK